MITVTLTEAQSKDAMELGFKRATSNSDWVETREFGVYGEKHVNGGIREHQCGAIGELAFSIYTGLPVDRGNHPKGDNGDFTFEWNGWVYVIDVKNRWEKGSDWQVQFDRGMEKGITTYIMCYMVGDYDVRIVGYIPFYRALNKHNRKTDYGRKGLRPAVNYKLLRSADDDINKLRAKYQLGI